MKKIKIKQLSIRNFKGVKELDINFNDKQSFIYGANEAGKTTVFDAFTWLLFGKDSFDRKDFSIKNTKHPELNRQEHEVEGVLLVNDEVVTLKRIYKENWSKPKGSTRAVLTGNKQEFYWNDVPMQSTQFAVKINELVDETVFKLITNALYFNSLNWAKRREFLFKLAGEISDQDVALSSNKFDELVKIITNKSFDGYKAELSAKKKKLKDDLEAIPTRIDELSKSLPEVLDFVSILSEIKGIEQQIKEIDNQISDRSKAHQTHLDKISEKQRAAHNLKTDIQNIEFGLESEFRKRENESGSERISLFNRVEEIRRNINSKEILKRSQSEKMAGLDQRRESLRNLFNTTNEKEIEFNPNEFCCPTCKRDFEANDIESRKDQLIKNFIADKNKALDEIETKGIALKAEITECESMIKTIDNALIGLQQELQLAEQNLASFDAKPKVSIEFNLASEVSKNEEHKALTAQLEAINEEISSLSSVNQIDNSELTTKKQSLNQQLAELNKSYAVKEQIERTENRINELKSQESNFAQQLAELESKEDELDAFTKAKIEMVEERINGKFQFVKFKMYDYTIEGNPVETCETMYKGVPFKDLNTAHKIWAGIDIINTLSGHYNVYAPIFLDNRESVTSIPSTDSQVVNLIVSPEDQVLRVA